MNVERIDSFDNAIIYKLWLDGDVPTSLKKDYTAVYLKNAELVFLVPMEFNRVFRVSNQLMIGGFYSNRELEYYTIFQIKHKDLEIVLDTRSLGDFGLKVYNTPHFRDHLARLLS